MGMISHESVEPLEIGVGHIKQGLSYSCGGLELSFQSEEDAAQRNVDYKSALLEVQNFRYCTW